MEPKDYLTQIVAPNLARYEADPCDFSLMYAAVITLYHTGDHIAYSTGKTPSALHREFASNLPDFSILQALATAQKHAIINHRRQNNPHFGATADNIEQDLAFWNGEPFFWLNGEPTTWGSPIFKLQDGTEREIQPIVSSIFNQLVITYCNQ